LIYESPEAFGSRKSDGTDPYTGARRAYHKALFESGAFVAGDPLEVPETGTTIRIKDEKRGVQDGSHADTKEQLGGSPSLSCHRLMQPLVGNTLPAASLGAVEVRPLAPQTKRRNHSMSGSDDQKVHRTLERVAYELYALQYRQSLAFPLPANILAAPNFGALFQTADAAQNNVGPRIGRATADWFAVQLVF